jgi:hypothetical protein
MLQEKKEYFIRFTIDFLSLPSLSELSCENCIFNLPFLLNGKSLKKVSFENCYAKALPGCYMKSMRDRHDGMIISVTGCQLDRLSFENCWISHLSGLKNVKKLKNINPKKTEDQEKDIVYCEDEDEETISAAVLRAVEVAEKKQNAYLKIPDTP